MLLFHQLLRKLQHTLDGLDGFGSNVGINLDLRILVAEAVIYLFKGIEAHIVALVAAASSTAFDSFGRSRDKLLVGAALLHLVQDTRLGDYDKLLLVALLGIGA